MTNACFPHFRGDCLQCVQPETLQQKPRHHPPKSSDKLAGTRSLWFAEQWIYFSLVLWNYVGFIAQSALTGMLLSFEAFSFKQSLLFPLWRKYLAQEPAWSALPAVQRGLRDEQSLRPPHCWAWWWLPHGSICFSSSSSVWSNLIFLYVIFSILCKLLGHLKYQIRGSEMSTILRGMLFPQLINMRLSMHVPPPSLLPIHMNIETKGENWGEEKPWKPKKP